MLAAAAGLARFENLLAQRLGFQSDAPRREGLADVLAARLRSTASANSDTYCARFQDRAFAAAELGALADELSIKESYFFRGQDHWNAFTDEILPALLHSRAGSRRLRILCAGCAAGEEPYTAAMLLQEHLAALAGWDIEIVGIDASPAAIDRARAGLYSPWSLRAAAADMKERYFRPLGSQLELAPAIRSSVRFEVRNLLDDDALFWHPGAFDVVFCRNVFIYFTAAAMAAVVERFAAALTPGGFVFLGHSETLRGVSRAFHLCSHADTFYYRLRLPDDPVEPDPLFELWQRASSGAADDAPAPLELVPDDSWVEATQRISDRIERVTSRPRAAAPAALAPVPAVDWSRAMELYAQERYGEVEGLLAVAAAAGDRDALLVLAAALTNRGCIASAEEACRRLLAADEFSVGAHYLYALCREHAGDSSGAEARLQTATYLDPQFAMAQLQLGRLARRGGRLDVARRHCSAALSLLLREDAARLLLFGGGFSREMLAQICRNELNACGDAP